MERIIWLTRTTLVISTMVMGLSMPFFGLVMALIGSLLTMLVTLILPCACYLSILRGKITCFQVWPRCNLHLHSFMLNITISVTYF
ncbi:Amino acid transporter AVT1B [Camellia lanceoleosa]|uniref:Amino acid transporter AVT1B n=1 Tax=Camellia lanceoleosa TaxID=1840588 RepID=A0ACC0FWQ0_9ERIC|nr:Amino acid transporter AVT1B [Camellia lanceoleosa]